MFDSTKEDLKDILKKVDAGIVGVPADRIIRTNFGRDIQLDLSKPEFEFEHDLFPLNQVFDHTDWYFSWRGHWKARKPDRFDLETKFFKGIVENIQRYKMPIIRLDKKNTREAICLVFEKVNVGGKKLDAFELVTAIYAASSFDLREDWHGPVGKPAQGRSGRMIDKDNPRRVLKEVESTDFLQACTLLHTRQVRLAKAAAGAKDDDLPAISCKREALLGLPLAGYRAHADAVEEGFIEAAGFLNELKIILAKDVPYAERGPRAIAEAVEHGGNTDFESGFEQAVWQALTARGLSVDTQIGCAGYRVDLAVRDPDRPGSYLLGIECDGAAYHSAKTARDRDRLRQSVLEGLGWRIERIWSTEWRVNQERCLRQIDQAIESARKHQSDIRESRLKSTVQTVVRPEESSTPPAQAATSNLLMSASDASDSPAEGRAAVPLAADRSTPEPPRYRCASSPRLLSTLDVFDISTTSQAVEAIGIIIDSEGPIVEELALRRLASWFGVQRVTDRFRTRFGSILRHALTTGRTRDQHGVLWPAGQSDATYIGFRAVGTEDEARRELDLIPLCERANAVVNTLEQQFGLPRGELEREVADVFGFVRLTARARELVGEAIDAAIASGRAVENEGYVSPVSKRL